MTDEIIPNLFRLSIPLPKGVELGGINAYLVKTPQGSLLVDTGWGTDRAFDALIAQMQDAGVTPEDLRFIVITHAHPDHYGLVGRLRPLTQAKIVLHEVELPFVDSRYVHVEDLIEEMDRWLEHNGVPVSTRPMIGRASLESLRMVSVAAPDLIVHGDELIAVGDRSFKVLWTPGHSDGHICLYEEATGALIAGDHLLPSITPNVGMHVQSVSNPLVNYLNSLEELRRLPIEWILPAHGDPFTGIEQRVEEIKAHHEERMAIMLGAFQGEPKTAYQIAMAYPWMAPGTRWEDMQGFHKRMAIAETISHLELLLARGRLQKSYHQGIIWYCPVG